MAILANAVSIIITIIIYLLIARAVLSWLFVAGVRNEFLYRLNYALATLTEPLMAPLRRIIPPMGMIDITPLIAIIVLIVIQQVIVSVLA